MEFLRELLNVASGGVVFTTSQKFFPDEKSGKHPLLSDRRNIVVIADEVHRSQYEFIDGFAKHIRDALPKASFIGFTGTPIESGDKNTQAVFGDLGAVPNLQLKRFWNRASCFVRNGRFDRSVFCPLFTRFLHFIGVFLKTLACAGAFLPSLFSFLVRIAPAPAGIALSLTGTAPIPTGNTSALTRNASTPAGVALLLTGIAPVPARMVSVLAGNAHRLARNAHALARNALILGRYAAFRLRNVPVPAGKVSVRGGIGLFRDRVVAVPSSPNAALVWTSVVPVIGFRVAASSSGAVPGLADGPRRRTKTKTRTRPWPFTIPAQPMIRA